MTRWSRDYSIPEDPDHPIGVGHNELLDLVEAGLLEERPGGPWGATHYSSDYDLWFVKL